MRKILKEDISSLKYGCSSVIVFMQTNQERRENHMFFVIEKLEKFTRALEKHRYIEMTPITPMISMEGGKSADELYIKIPEKVEGPPLDIGDEFVGRDKYLWVQTNVEIPEQRTGCEVAGLFDLGKTGGGHNSGFESLLYIDGKPYQGVDSNHMDVLLEDYAGTKITLTLLLWTGLEGGGPKQIFRHRINQAHIGYLHRQTDDFYYLSKAIYKTIKLLPDTSVEKYDLTEALDEAYKLINWDEDKFHSTVGAALDRLLDILDGMEKHSAITVNVVGHTHIDVAWLWRLKHTREKSIRSFSTVLRLMAEFEEYSFLQSQPQLYKYIKNDCPELYESIKKRIAGGQWEADGGMWVEADCNISSGEALVRQLTHGIAFFKEEFNVKCEYLWLPDVFGYSWALPQILRQCNIKTFMTTKISWNQYNSIPNDLFRWRGIDGTEILTYFITTPEVGHSEDSRFSTYNGQISPRSVLGSWHKFKDKAISNETLISYGYGDGGGGPNRNMLKMRRAMDRLPGLPNVKTSSVKDFFNRIHNNVDNTDRYVHTWDGELYLEYHRGTYTSQANTKKMNRLLEFGIAKSEWVCSLNWLYGGEYPAARLHDAWETVLLHQFHDIIPGSSIREVYEDSDKSYAQSYAGVTDLTVNAMKTITLPDDMSFTLCHMGSFDRSDLVHLPVIEDGVFSDNDGNLLPAQKLDNGWLVNVEIPAIAMKTITFKPGQIHAQDKTFTIDMEAGTLESPLYSIEWNKDGNLTKLYDKQCDREVLTAGSLGNVLEIYEDMPLAHNNWDIDIYYTQKREVVMPAGAAELVENGSERCVIRFTYAYNLSGFTQDMIVYKDNRRIDFITHVSWHEADRLLKVAFQTDIRATKATYDIQFGHVERPTHFNTSWDWARFEVVGHKWADISETDYGVALLNNCKYGYNIKDSNLRLTLLKSSKMPDTECDMGEHDFTYALMPHTGTVMQGGVLEESIKLNHPVDVYAGKLREDVGRLVVIDSDSIHIDALKKAENEDCLVLRVHECRGTRQQIKITSDHDLKKFAPCNLLEEDLMPPTAGKCIETVVKPFEIKTYKLWFR